MPDTAALQAALAEALAAADVEHADVSVLAGAPERARRRLRFYRGNVQANARKALHNAFPVCAQIVGNDFFEGLANAYAAATPSRNGDLNEYGDGFAPFIAGFAPAASVPYLAAVAELEWRVHRAHYAADGPSLDLRALAAIAPERFSALRVGLHPACALYESPWPVVRIWAVHQPGHAGDFDVDLDAGPERALVHRPRYRVDVAALEAGAFAFLGACADGASLGDATSAALAAQPQFTLDAHLAGWVRDRVVIDLREV
jgi:uncharacterized protein